MLRPWPKPSKMFFKNRRDFSQSLQIVLLDSSSAVPAEESTAETAAPRLANPDLSIALRARPQISIGGILPPPKKAGNPRRQDAADTGSYLGTVTKTLARFRFLARLMASFLLPSV